MTEGFATKVATAVAATGPMCAGIDPSADLLGAWGLADTPEGLRAFGLSCVEAFAGVVPVVKPQVAFFERLGSGGMAALEEVLAAARDAGLVTIAVTSAVGVLLPTLLLKAGDAWSNWVLGSTPAWVWISDQPESSS